MYLTSTWLVYLSELVVVLSIPLFGLGFAALVRIMKGAADSRMRPDILTVSITWGLLVFVLLSRLAIIAAYSVR